MTIPHGTVNGYNNYRCRCTPCRAARRAYYRERRAAYHAQRLPDQHGRPIALVADNRHGKTSTYIAYGCRCTLCTFANSRR